MARVITTTLLRNSGDHNIQQTQFSGVSTFRQSFWKMDESWRMRMGMPDHLPRRKSTEETLSNRTRKALSGDLESIDPNDFNDVFGGPPRSVLSHKYSGDFSRTKTSFYEEIFRQPEPTTLTPSKSGRNLPAFRIPAKREGSRGLQRSEGFYSDIFGSDDEVRFPSRSSSNSKSKSRSNSSSVLSSEDLSPLRPATGDDAGLSTFASKLRPINVPCRWNSSTVMPAERPKEQYGMPAFPCNFTSYVKNQFMENDYNGGLSSSYFGFSRQVPSPESISLEPNLFESMKVSGDDDIDNNNSPSTGVSSICQEFAETKRKPQDSVMQDQKLEDEEDDDDDGDDEIMSSYVIEINSDYREGNGDAISIDEAIAWAKEKYQKHCSGNERSSEMEGRHDVHERTDGHEATHSLMEKEPGEWATEVENLQSEKDKVDMEMELLDEDIQLWATGKEANIRFLLSTLHHILWPNSGWCAIEISSLLEASNVKKAYQKARLCLHPDKLQQRGATLPQKYVAEKAFSILQDAWAAFISQDVFSS